MDKEGAPVVFLVLDVLKPHKPSIVEFGKILHSKGVSGSSISVYAVDEKTESVKVTLEGDDIDFDRIRSIIEDAGAVVHSIDKVVLGKNID